MVSNQKNVNTIKKQLLIESKDDLLNTFESFPEIKFRGMLFSLSLKKASTLLRTKDYNLATLMDNYMILDSSYLNIKF